MNFNTTSNENAILSKKIAELTKRIASLEFDRKEHLAKIESLNSDNDELKLKNTQLSNDYDELKLQNTQLSNDYDELKLKNTQLSNDYDNMNHKYSQMSKELADFDENKAREINMQEDIFRRSVIEDDNLNNSKLLVKQNTLNISTNNISTNNISRVKSKNTADDTKIDITEKLKQF